MTSLGRQANGLPEYERSLLPVVLREYPELVGDPVEVMSGQFNVVLNVGEIVIRFPRSSDAAASMVTETAILRTIHDCLPLPVPSPTLSEARDANGHPIFMSYRRIPGRPLDQRTVDELHNAQHREFSHLGQQLGGFLRSLHACRIDELAAPLPMADDKEHWTTMLEAFRRELFPFMRDDAGIQVERAFTQHLTSADRDSLQPVLRHGDFGGGNLLFADNRSRISGVIDFGGVALGDAAVDLAAITAFHPKLAQAMQPHYPGLFAPDLQRRASFYRSTFALQQALWAIRSGDQDEFEDGIAAYR